MYLRDAQANKDPADVSQVVFENQIRPRDLWVALPYSVSEAARKILGHHLLPRMAKTLKDVFIVVIDVLDSYPNKSITLDCSLFTTNNLLKFSFKLLFLILPFCDKLYKTFFKI